MSITALAKDLRLTPRTISDYEKGARPVPDALINSLVATLDSTPDFLVGPDMDPIDADSVFFRSRRRTTARDRAAALAAGRMGISLYEWFGERFNLPAPSIPTLEYLAPEDTAEAVASEWVLGTGAPPNMVHLLESRGVRVLTIPADSDHIDAFSTWNDGVPYVFLTAAKTPERARFDAAHELGHILLHSRNREQSDRDVEREADQFASALLMPRTAVLAARLVHPPLPQILRAKRQLKVSAMALARRVHDLDLMTEWEYRQTCIELARQGYRSSEPHGMARERSQVFTKTLGVLKERGITLSAIADECLLRDRDIHEMTFGLALASFDGDKVTGHRPSRPNLTIVR